MEKSSFENVTVVWSRNSSRFIEPICLLSCPQNTFHRPGSQIITFLFCGCCGAQRNRVSGTYLRTYLLTYLLTHSMVQSPSEANWFAASQEIPHISRNPMVHYRTHKRPPPVSILGQPNPVHIPTSHLLKIHPNIIHPSKPRSPQRPPSLRFPPARPYTPSGSRTQMFHITVTQINCYTMFVTPQTQPVPYIHTAVYVTKFSGFSATYVDPKESLSGYCLCT